MYSSPYKAISHLVTLYLRPETRHGLMLDSNHWERTEGKVPYVGRAEEGRIGLGAE